MKPYYESCGIKLYNADCSDILDSFLPKEIDLVLTDPPYGIGEAAGKNKSRGLLAKSKDFGNLTWDDKPISDELLQRIRKISENQIIFGGNYYNLPPSPCWIVWDKDNGETDFADCELAWTSFDSAVRKFKWRWQGMLQEDMAHKEIRVHPTQKPLALIKWCIAKYSKESERILDPFCGSGTTLVAAKQLGRVAIGIEREEKYCEIAVKRLAQMELFNH